MPRAIKSRSEAATATIPPADIAAPPGLFIGTSGWAYPSWKPDFYPADVSTKRLLAAYGQRLNSVEVNYTFRALPTEAMLDSWVTQTPLRFRFSFKAPQRITHFSRLRGCDDAVERFIDAIAPVRAAGRLGLLLFQLPPNFPADEAVLRSFLAAPALRRGGAPRIAFEFRHRSWFDEAIYQVLREHDAALCIAENDELVSPEVHTARTHTSFRLRQQGGYSADELRRFAERLLPLTTATEPREVFVYLKHEDQPTGALNAAELLRLASTVASSTTPGDQA